MQINKEDWYIIRADRAGVFFGHIAERDGSEVTMTDVRRIWYWTGPLPCRSLRLTAYQSQKIASLRFALTRW